MNPETMKNERLLTIREVAEMTGLAVGTIPLCKPAEDSSRAFVEAMHPFSLFGFDGVDPNLNPGNTLTMLKRRRIKMILKVKRLEKS